MKKIIPIFVALILVVGGGAFYGGMLYGKSQNTRLGFPSGDVATNFQGARTNKTGATGAGAGFLSGEIITKDEQSLILKMTDGSSKIIFYSDTTQISKMATGTADDFAIGTSVNVSGTTNSDGSVTAQSVQIRPDSKDKTGL